jgi:hypothetical protein
MNTTERPNMQIKQRSYNEKKEERKKDNKKQN